MRICGDFDCPLGSRRSTGPSSPRPIRDTFEGPGRGTRIGRQRGIPIASIESLPLIWGHNRRSTWRKEVLFALPFHVAHMAHADIKRRGGREQSPDRCESTGYSRSSGSVEPMRYFPVRISITCYADYALTGGARTSLRGGVAWSFLSWGWGPG